MPLTGDAGALGFRERLKPVFADKVIEYAAVHIIDVEGGVDLVGHALKRPAAICVGDLGPVTLDMVSRSRFRERGTDAAVPVQHGPTGVEGKRFDLRHRHSRPPRSIATCS